MELHPPEKHGYLRASNNALVPNSRRTSSMRDILPLRVHKSYSRMEASSHTRRGNFYYKLFAATEAHLRSLGLER
jgi:hypothetical protein